MQSNNLFSSSSPARHFYTAVKIKSYCSKFEEQIDKTIHEIKRNSPARHPYTAVEDQQAIHPCKRSFTRDHTAGKHLKLYCTQTGLCFYQCHVKTCWGVCFKTQHKAKELSRRQVSPRSWFPEDFQGTEMSSEDWVASKGQTFNNLGLVQGVLQAFTWTQGNPIGETVLQNDVSMPKIDHEWWMERWPKLHLNFTGRLTEMITQYTKRQTEMIPPDRMWPIWHWRERKEQSQCLQGTQRARGRKTGKKFSLKLSSWLHIYKIMMIIAHPEPASYKSRDAQGSGVMSKPGKVESNLQPKVFRDLAWWMIWTIHARKILGKIFTKGLKAENLSDPRLLQLLKAWCVMEGEHLK